MKTFAVFALLLLVTINQSAGQSAYRPTLQRGSFISNISSDRLFAIMCQVGFSYMQTSALGRMLKYDGETSDARLMKWQAGMGYAFFLRENIAIEPSFSYRKSSTKTDHDFWRHGR